MVKTTRKNLKEALEIYSKLDEVVITTRVPQFHFDDATIEYIDDLREVITKALYENAGPDDTKEETIDKIQRAEESLNEFHKDVMDDLEVLLASIDV